MQFALTIRWSKSSSQHGCGAMGRIRWNTNLEHLLIGVQVSRRRKIFSQKSFVARNNILRLLKLKSDRLTLV